MSTTTNLNNILSGLGKLTRSCSDVRHCSRCNQPLTDPSSWERGIGPICAKKDTHLFARTIGANYAMASIHALNIQTQDLPEVLRPVWVSLLDVFLQKMANATKGTSDNQFVIAGEDCRIVCRVIDFMLSYRMSGHVKQDLIAVVRHLGFIGLAGVLSGQSSTGEAELKFEDGNLFLTGSKNKAGYEAMRVIPGIVLPNRRTGSAYKISAKQYAKFIDAVIEFWPCFSGEVDNIRTQCKEWNKNHPTVQSFQETNSNSPQAKIQYRSATDEVVVSFEWMKEITPRLVEEIKKINFKERRYDSMTRTWTIRASHRQTIKDILSPHYNVLEEENACVSVPSIGTPSNTYQKPYRYGRRFY